jgi:hypothetical protein
LAFGEFRPTDRAGSAIEIMQVAEVTSDGRGTQTARNALIARGVATVSGAQFELQLRTDATRYTIAINLEQGQSADALNVCIFKG